MADSTNRPALLNHAQRRIADVRRILSSTDPVAAANLEGTEIAARKALLPGMADVKPVAFLATYNDRPSCVPRPSPWPPAPLGPPLPFPVPPPPPLPPDLVREKPMNQTVYPLASGVNRIGWDEWCCDFREPRCSSTDSRQWLILMAEQRAFVVDDGASNPSFVLRRDAPRLSGSDPRFDPVGSGMRREPESMIPLDWEGRTVVELFEGDTLVVAKAPHVFSWITAPSARISAPGQSSSAPPPGPATAHAHVVRDILLGAERDNTPRSTPIHVCRETTSIGHVKGAFLASFTSHTVDVVFPLREGRNRIGWSLLGGDFQEPPFAPCHEVQWVVLLTGREAWIVTFVPAFGTLVLPAGSRSHSTYQSCLADDGTRLQLLSAPPPDAIVLDRLGRGYRRLEESDILVTKQAALVFGWLPEGGR